MLLQPVALRFFMTAMLLFTWTSAQASVVYYMLAIPEAKVASPGHDGPALSEALTASSGPDNLYLEKSWHGVHWLLCGATGKNSVRLSHLVFGGRELPTELDYGRPRLHTAAEVKAFSRLLASVTLTQLRSRFNPKRMDAEKVYPEDWQEDSAEWLDYLLADFAKLKAFVDAAANNNKAIVYAWG
jgi:hypothetical protein